MYDAVFVNWVSLGMIPSTVKKATNPDPTASPPANPINIKRITLRII
jgi:hypothetical protein